MSVIVVDYDAGNLRSVETALSHLGAEFTVSSDPKALHRADRIIFPGVGDGSHAMQVLGGRGLAEAMQAAFERATPILGICVGCQIVFDKTEEGDAACLGLIPGAAKRFAGDLALKIPHMGWNAVRHEEGHWLFEGIKQEASFYFVHSYYPAPACEEHVIARTDYGISFAAGVERDSLVAVQFHPEKSGEAGLKLLSNFLSAGRR
jgi:imidazole glycerol-phosphate synthase subunit HisH